MNLSSQQLRQYADAVDAAYNEKDVEFYDSATGVWKQENYHPSIWTNAPHRPKPEPKTRPWSKPEDVPGPVCWIRCNAELECLVVRVASAGVRVEGELVIWSELSEFKYSTDRKTWHKCEVQED